jgi:hypothetical protein
MSKLTRHKKIFSEPFIVTGTDSHATDVVLLYIPVSTLMNSMVPEPPPSPQDLTHRAELEIPLAPLLRLPIV